MPSRRGGTDVKIGIDALSVKPGKTGGGETYAVHLISALAEVAQQHRFVVFSLPGFRDRFSRVFPHVTFQEVPIAAGMKGAVPARFLFEQLILPSRIRKLGIECMFFTGNTMSLACPCPSVLTIHDMSSFFYRETFPGILDIATGRILPLIIALSARRADRICAITEFTKREILKYVSISPEKVSVVYSGGGETRWKASEQPDELPEGVRRPYIFSIGTQHIHKNYECLCRAFVAVKNSEGLPYQLIIAGMEGNGTGRLQQVLQELACPEIRVVGAVSLRQLQSLYCQASAVILPSLYEGFGLPLLEAMAAGAPVFSSNAGPSREIAGDAAFFFDPFDQQAIENALCLGMTDKHLIEELRCRGKVLISQGSRFSWTSAAVKMLGLFEKAANRCHTAGYSNNDVP